MKRDGNTEAHASTIAQGRGEQSTERTTGPGHTNTRTPSPLTDEPSNSGRDIVAAVIFYTGERALFGGDEAKMRAAKVTPPTLGKYTLDSVLGQGGKGAVLLGKHPDLNIEVAVKVLRRDSHDDRTAEGIRLLREATVLARLEHPNIVPILDAGEERGDRYVVMRRIRGGTLRKAQQGASWQTIVDRYILAGRGLAAVHAAGLIHRDFKADNVLVDDEGRVMLADFGLVCRAGDGATVPATAPTRAAFDAAIRVTRTGEIHGTPAYMAPEAYAAGAAGVPSDIFSFAAALFEALHGELPFVGDSPIALCQAMIEGAIRPRPANSRVPAWLDAALRRALAAEPTARPPSMDAMLAAIDHRARRTRHRLILGGVALSAGVGLFAAQLGPTDPCAAPEARLADLWGAETRDRLAGSGDTGRRLSRLVDEFVGAWTRTFTTVCRATHHQGMQSSELLDTRMRCLTERRDDLAVLTQTLTGEPPPAALDDALLAAARLESPRPCATRTGLVPPPDATQADAVARLSHQLADVRGHELRGDYPEGRALAENLVTEAREVGYDPLLVDASLALGRAAWLTHDHARARAAAREALDLAERRGLDERAADAASLLVKISALSRRDGVLAGEWATLADRKLTRITGDAWRRAELLSNRGLLAFHLEGAPQTALSLHDEALAMRRKLQDDGEEARIWIAESYQNRGTVQAALGDVTGSLASCREARRIAADVLGLEHPHVGELLFIEAAREYGIGNLEHAHALATDSLNLLAAATDRVALARIHHLLSGIEVDRGQLDPALTHATQALALADEAPNRDPVELAEMYDRLGTVQRDRRDYPLALAAFARGLAQLAGTTEGGDDVRLALHFNRGELHVETGKFADAHADFAAAEALLDAAGPTLAAYRPYIAKGIATAYLGEHNVPAARRRLEQALAALPPEGDAALRAEIQRQLASIDPS